MDKSRFDHLVEKRMRKRQEKAKAPKLDFNMLVEMMEQFDGLMSLNEGEEAPGAADAINLARQNLPADWIDKLPKFEISERWGIGEKKPEDENAARQEFRKYMDNIEGPTIQEKLASIEKFVNQSISETPGKESTKTIISNLMFLDLLATVVNNFSPSGAGFLFEAFLAGLLQGTQMVEKTEGGVLDIDDLVDKDNRPISLKLLAPTTVVKGSIRNLINFIALNEKALPQAGRKGGIEYLCVYKYGKEQTKALGMYSFQITADNIYYWLEKSLKFNITLSESLIPGDQIRRLIMEADFEKERTKAGQLSDEELKKLRKTQEDNMKKVIAAIGGSPSFYNKSDEIRKRLGNVSQATKTAINTIIKNLGVEKPVVDAAQLINPEADLSATLAGRKELKTKIRTLKDKRKIGKSPAGLSAKKLYDEISDDQKKNFFLERITKVSNKDDVVEKMISPDGKEGLKMLEKVASDYKFSATAAKLDVDTKSEYEALTDDEFEMLLLARKKLKDDLRKGVPADNKYLGWFKQTYDIAAFAGDQAETVADFKNMFYGTGKYAEGKTDRQIQLDDGSIRDMTIKELRAEWRDALLKKAGLIGAADDDAKDEKSQFEISSDMITKQRLPAVYDKVRLGVLLIDRQQILDAANKYAGQISENVVRIFIALHDLTAGLTDYFLQESFTGGTEAKTALTNLNTEVAAANISAETTSEV